MNAELLTLAAKLGECLSVARASLAVAESCTGGLIAATLTEIPGSSHWFDRGFVTYSDKAKQQMLGVQSQTLLSFGAVSRETALEMVQGARLSSGVDYAIAVTGIAGPGGATLTKPVGTVYIAWASKTHEPYCERLQLNGDRHAIRVQTVQRALQYLLETVRSI